ncbi:hypothetical protein GIB67_042345 [Kingdonia uniflora]|uniref:Uncharacterized protein n=1 Tax=Kingdonia uniflora TaxID=39325 RepID=A0A7J7LB57_9MAGN|nr:hypothetical protein GIB67_042345 [Kingdonia uniflora]
MARSDHKLVEDLFADGHVQVLVSTATLAWGVYLPAHTVIIKGTQIYNPDKGAWTELNPLDVMQMLGRAGRPEYDQTGEGIILTGHGKTSVLPLTNESTTYYWKSICIEIGGSRNPVLYGMASDYMDRDPTLEDQRADLIHSAATILDKNNLVKYDSKSGYFQATDLGRIASFYYITHGTIATYNEHLKPTMGDIELCQLFSLSEEFKYVTVRQDEKMELAKLLERVPIPIKENLDEPSAKINVLLQAYISQLKLEGFSLTSDMVFITQSAGRLLRALFEIILKRGWAQLAEKALNLCKMINNRIWSVQTPLHRFGKIPNDILTKLEKDFPWDRYYDINSKEIGELLTVPKMWLKLHKFIHQFPKFNLAAHIQPITHTVLRIELTITPDFQWDDTVHEKYSPPAELLDLQPLPVTALRNPAYENLYQEFKHFSPVQTQVFNILYNGDDNTLVATPAGSGKTICAEFALLRSHQKGSESVMRIVYIAHIEALAKERFRDWEDKFGKGLGMKVVQLTGETKTDLKLLEKGQVIISTPEKWDALSRRWKQRKHVQQVSLFIGDKLHLICGQRGPILEVIVSRMRYIASQSDNKIRIVAFSSSLANAKDLGEWIGATSRNLFNFPPEVRPVPLEIRITGMDINSFEARMQEMTKPTYTAIVQHTKTGKPALVFVPTRKHARLTAKDLVTDPILKETLSSGVGYLHKGLSILDQEVVSQLFEAGCIHYVLQVVRCAGMMDHASRPHLDNSGKCVILCHAPPKDYYKKFLYYAFPVESHLHHYLHDNLNAEVVARVIENKQDAVDYLTWTFMYRILTQNPNYYNIQGVSHKHLSDHLSELVENTLSDLEASKCVAIANDTDLSPSILGMVASYYYVSYNTIKRFSSSLTLKTKMKGLLEILTSASEYAELPVRPGEDETIRRLINHLKLPFNNPKYTDCDAQALYIGSLGVSSAARAKLDFKLVRVSWYQSDLVESDLVAMAEGPNATDPAQVLAQQVGGPSINPRPLNTRTRLDQLEDKMLALSGIIDQVTTLEERLDGFSDDQAHVGERLVTLEGVVEGNMATLLDQSSSQSQQRAGSSNNYNKGKNGGYQARSGGDQGHGQNRSGGASAGGASSSNSGREYHRPRVSSVARAKLDFKLVRVTDPHVKANVLLQAHFSLVPVAGNLASDQREVLLTSSRLLQAMVDVISSKGWLNLAIFAMEVNQMVTQGIWERDSMLLQVPHFTKELAKKCEENPGKSIETIFDLVDMEDDERKELLQMSESQMQDIIRFCNRFPIIYISYEVLEAEDVKVGEDLTLQVTLERDLEERSEFDDEGIIYLSDFKYSVVLDSEDNIQDATDIDSLDEDYYSEESVAACDEEHNSGDNFDFEDDIVEISSKQQHCPPCICFISSVCQFPNKISFEGWWLIVGDTKSNQMLAIKRVSLQRKSKVKLQLVPGESGKKSYMLYFICDSYMGCDQEYSFSIDVKESAGVR